MKPYTRPLAVVLTAVLALVVYLAGRTARAGRCMLDRLRGCVVE